MFRKLDSEGKSKRFSIPIDCQQAIKDGEEIRVEQSHKDEVDINRIIQRHAGNEDLIASTANIQQLRFDDNPLNDFQEAMNMLIEGKQAFASMPSAIRRQFNNNPAAFMDYVQNAENKEQLQAWGILEKDQIPDSPIEVKVVNETVNEKPSETP